MPRFRADCSSCCGLCCVVPAQLAVQGFGTDKPADTPCTHLTAEGSCSIHDERIRFGYSACVTFDCFGAGQWITEHVIGSVHWKYSPELARRMFGAYRRWLPRFRAAALIEAALPHVRSDCQEPLIARMNELVSRDLMDDSLELDQQKLEAETLAIIRKALRP